MEVERKANGDGLGVCIVTVGNEFGDDGAGLVVELDPELVDG